MSGFRRYVELFAPYRGRYVAGLLVLFLTNALSLLVPWLVKGGIDSLATTRKVATSVVQGPFEHPYGYAIALVGVALVLSVTRTASRVLILGGGRYVGRDLKERLYRRLLRADPSFYGRFGTGEIMSRCTSDVQVVQAVGAPGMLYTFNAVFMFAIAVPYIFTVSWQLTLLLLLPFPFLAALTWWAASRVRTYATESQEAMADLTTHLQETLAGMEVVKAFTLEDHQAGRFSDSNDRYLATSMKEAIARGMIGIAAVLVGGFGTVVILYVGGTRVARGELTYGDLALFMSVMALVLRPTIFLGWVLSLAQRGLASLDRLEELLHAPLAVEQPQEPRHTGPVQGAITVSGLTYRYPNLITGGVAEEGDASERRRALEDVAFALPAGGVLGLVGRIGSGKSTVLRAIPRFLEVPAGSVQVDGVPIEAWDLPALRSAIGYVPQDGTVFSLSLRENTAFGRHDATEAEIAEAIRLAALDQDLDQLDEGLETLVGERGVTLSGGQRQRLSIARALLIKPRILLLDDALSMVDAETAVAILNNLKETLPGTTVLIAAHRTATLLGCDELLVLEEGRIVERGAPADLLARTDSRFAVMHERQKLQSEIEGAE